MDTRSALPVNTLLDGCYRIVRAVGSGGFGITYEAEDVSLGTTVAIKEYYPCDFGDRDATMSVRPKSERHGRPFAWGRASFLEEARTLARFEHPSIVGVSRVFEANSTAYMVMRYERGQSLEQWIANLGRPPTEAEIDRILFPLLDALDVIHKDHFLHRDIAPDNIVIRTDGSPVLLDFGAARRSLLEVSRSLTGLVKPGYSPLEQYSGDSRLQGPWSDLYALGGTLYRVVTGVPPEEATLRVDEDRVEPAVLAAKGRYRESLLGAIDACLAVKAQDRPQSAHALRAMLHVRDAKPRSEIKVLVSSLIRLSRPPSHERSHPQLERTRRSVPKRPGRTTHRLGAAAVVLGMIGSAYAAFDLAPWSPNFRWSDMEREMAAEAQEARRIAALTELSRKEADARLSNDTADAYENVRVAALEEASRRDARMAAQQLASEEGVGRAPPSQAEPPVAERKAPLLVRKKGKPGGPKQGFGKAIVAHNKSGGPRIEPRPRSDLAPAPIQGVR